MVDVLLLTIDSLRFDRLDTERFPESLPLLREDFAEFERAYSHGVATPFAFHAIQTGKLLGRRPSLPEDVPTIAELTDGPTLAFANNQLLTANRGYDRGFDEFDSLTPTADFPPYKPAGETLPELDSRLSEELSFVWWHTMDTHFPHTPYATMDRPTELKISKDELREMNHSFTDGNARDRHLDYLSKYYNENARYLDRKLAAFLRSLHDRDDYDQMLVVITSDHGECFGEDGWQGHPFEANPVDELVHVPLFVKFPGETHAGRRFDHVVAHRDVRTTIGAHLGADADELAGRRLTDTARRCVVSKSNEAIRATTTDGKLIERRDGTRRTQGEISERMESAVSRSPFPNVNEVPEGYEEFENLSTKERLQRLRDLGYQE